MELVSCFVKFCVERWQVLNLYISPAWSSLKLSANTTPRHYLPSYHKQCQKPLGHKETFCASQCVLKPLSIYTFWWFFCVFSWPQINLQGTNFKATHCREGTLQLKQGDFTGLAVSLLLFGFFQIYFLYCCLSTSGVGKQAISGSSVLETFKENENVSDKSARMGICGKLWDKCGMSPHGTTLWCGLW